MERSGEGALFDYHGQMLRFPAGTVSAQIVDNREPYARLLPEGVDSKFTYFIDLGRKRTGTRSNGYLWLGFLSLSGKASSTELGDGHILWCDGGELDVYSCAALLKELPYAAVNFVVGRRPDRARARMVVNEAEAYLRLAKVIP